MWYLMMSYDVMDEVGFNAELSKLFMHGRSHLGCSLILMLQNIFPNGKHSRTISINAQDQTLFCNPHNSLQISTLATQLFPIKIRDFLEMYKKRYPGSEVPERPKRVKAGEEGPLAECDMPL